MGDSTAASRPRKSTMSKIGRVFGISSTNLAHEASEHRQDSNKSPEFYDNHGDHLEIPSSTGSSSQISASNGSSPSVKDLGFNSSLKSGSEKNSIPHSPLSSPLLTLQIPNPIPNRQSSLRTPPYNPTTDSKMKSGRVSPVTDHDRSSASLSRSSSTAGQSKSALANSQRFVMLENGTHEHHLRNAKRQEKIGHMIKDLLGAKKLRSEAVSAVPNILSSVIPPISENSSHDTANEVTAAGHLQVGKNAPPTLFAGLINQVKRGEITPYSGGPINNQAVISATSTIKLDSRSFIEKYGRCQEVIGRGAFGVVRVSHKKDENGELLYAVKEFKRKPQESDKTYSRRLTSEFCISSSLQHVNIIHTLDLLQDAKGDYCEVMEFCSGGDLYSLIITSGKLEYVEADCFFKQLMRGVNYMHEMGVAHRDLKPENLLLTANGGLKITDFGNGELFRTAWESEVHLSGGICGSSPYIAPEEYTASEFDPRKVDIWSCGVIYMAMRTGRQLWKLANLEDEFYSTYLEKRKDAKGYEPIESLKRARCRNVIYSILDPVPNRRITSKQILNSEWCREIKLCHAGEGK